MPSWVTKQGFDAAAVEAMKPRIQAIEAEAREAFPAAGMSPEQLHSRSSILSALGSLGSADARRLSNAQYAEVIKDSIDLVVTGAHTPDAQNDKIQGHVRDKVSHDRTIMAGLGQLEAAVIVNLHSKEAQR